MDRQEFRTRVAVSKALLEDVSGKRVYGFRAPDFSVVESSRWALDIIRDVGFLYDSSIYPLGFHDVYGIRDALPYVHRLPNGLLEFPLSTIEFFGRRFPFGGGGYFRLYPLVLTRLCMSALNKQGQPFMFYIHPYEVGPVIPRITGLSWYRRYRHYYNCHNGDRRFARLAKGFSFGPAVEILRGKGLLEG
jgi:polysaccharide deacetylase family protein (PEP-CTERM system associated)